MFYNNSLISQPSTLNQKTRESLNPHPSTLNLNLDPAFPLAFQKSEDFLAFCSFAESYITSLDNRRLRSVLRNKSETCSQQALQQLVRQIATEAWLRAREMSGSRADNILIQLGFICTDLELYIEDFEFYD